MDWQYTKDGQKFGPIPAEKVHSLITNGTLGPDTLVWNKGMGHAWSKISDVFIFAVHFKKPDPDSDAEFKRRLAEKHENDVRRKKRRKMKLITTLVVILGAVAGYFYWIHGGEQRKRGVDPSHPLGVLPTYDTLFVQELQMLKTQATPRNILPKTSLKAFTYSNPKGQGAHVTALGLITLYVNDAGRVEQIYAEFPSAGQRGPLWIDRSVAWIQMTQLWSMLKGDENREIKYTKDAPKGLPEQYGFRMFPQDGGTYATLDTPNATCLWVEYGPYCAQSMLLFKVK